LQSIGVDGHRHAIGVEQGNIVMGNDIVMEIDITYVELNQVIHVEKRESVE